MGGEGDLRGIAPRLDSMDIDGLGDSFDTRDTDSEDEGIKEGRKKKRQVVFSLRGRPYIT